MPSLLDLKVQIYADGADKAGILDLYAKPYIKGLTTNPTLMKKAGIKDYEIFARDILQTVTAKPVSLEVFADDFPEMKRQALKIASWAPNVYVKIPVTNTRAESSAALVREKSLALRRPYSPSYEPIRTRCGAGSLIDRVAAAYVCLTRPRRATYNRA